MLNVLKYGQTYSEPCVLILGGFDGLHLGHRALLKQAEKKGLPVGITTIVGGKGGMLFTPAEREYLFQRAGIDFVYEIAFTDELKNTAAVDFLRVLFDCVNAQAVFCGEDFRFGKDAAGNADLLKRLAPCEVCVGKIIKSDYMRAHAEHAGMRKISVSACKQHLSDGDMNLLNECLLSQSESFFDCAYFIQGIVEHGREVGRTYGFPTLNLSLSPEKLLPKDGVYGGFAQTSMGRYRTIINIGARPTFGVAEKKLEAYLDGFSGDLYGEAVRIYPTEFYRAIERFDSVDKLKEQLQKDIQRLRGNV